MYRHTESKELLIPDHVFVGAVIGKGGSNCKAIREKHRVRCFVDKNNHKVLLKGNPSGVKNAEGELNQLFEELAVADNTNKDRAFEVVVRDGSTRLWSFEQEKHPSSDLQVKDYTYRLQQGGKAEKSSSRSKSWIQEFQEDETKSVMAYLVKQPFGLPLKVKVSFGKLFPTDIEVLSSVNYFLDRASKSTES